MLFKDLYESQMKNAMYDLIERAAKSNIPRGADDDAYVLALAKKVLQLDTAKLFKGDLQAAEEAVRNQVM